MLSLSQSPPASLPYYNPFHRKSPLSSPASTKNCRSFEPLRDQLIQYVDGGHLQKAVSTVNLMAKRGIHPDLFTCSQLLKSCIRSGSFHLGKLVHNHLIQSGLEFDSVMYNLLISMYSKSGQWTEAHMIFESMGNKRDLVSWSSMISCFVNNNMEVKAVLTFLDMLEGGFWPNEYCFASVIQACSNENNLSIGTMILGFLIKTGYFDSDVNVSCSLIDMFVKGNGDLESAYKVFGKILKKNVVSWTLMITRCSQLGRQKDSIDLFSDMVLSGYLPDQFTLSSVISACAELGLLFLGKQLHSWVFKLGMILDVFVGCSLVDMYAKCMVDGSMDYARRAFDRMPKHSVMSWTAVITGYVQSGGRNVEGVRLFSKMVEGMVQPNHLTFSSVLKACENLSDSRMGEQVYSLAVKNGLASNSCVGNSFISMHAKSGLMDDAQKAFESILNNHLFSCTRKVDAYAKDLHHGEVTTIFHDITNKNIEVDAFEYASLLSAASNVGAIGNGEQLHAHLLKSGFRSNNYICNALISMYSRFGNIEDAFKVFCKMGSRNVISWTSMITGFAKHGFATKALEIFYEMLDTGVKPNSITYIAVLSACSHAGLVSEGWMHFNLMLKKHGVVPKMEHYACMVDLLGRCGSLVEAMEFISSMPHEPDAIVWRTFLGACQVHGNTELGGHAAKLVLRQDPNDPAAYILLSNLYASAGLWEDVAEIRRRMKQGNMIKEAGCSWVEVKNKVHKFHVGDTSHPQAEEIYDKLDELASEIKVLGYVPNTDFVLHDLEEELKEHYLLQHSEKIAVAFGLLSISEPKPIRVFKNLRVCGDCHEAIKYISMATGRKIILRDSKRFHHINDGTCSCNDYW